MSTTSEDTGQRRTFFSITFLSFKFTETHIKIYMHVVRCDGQYAEEASGSGSSRREGRTRFLNSDLEKMIIYPF